MFFWSFLGVLLLVLILSVTIIFVGFRRNSRGIIVSSNWLKIMDTGAVTVIISIGGMAALFFLQTPFYIGIILLTMGVVYIVFGLIYRKQWTKWVSSCMQSKNVTG